MGGNCSGMGCCETAIPRGLFTFDATISSFSRHRSCWEYNPCGYAFLVEKSSFAFDVSDIRGTAGYRDPAPPVIVDWSIGNQTCRQVQGEQSLTSQLHVKRVDQLGRRSKRTTCICDYILEAVAVATLSSKWKIEGR